MGFQWIRRALLGLASGAVLLALGACGSGTIESQFRPTRVVVFGDAFSDVGQKGGRYTVNDNTLNSWVLLVAGNYGLTVTPSASGGTAYATGNARITNKPDAAGDSTTPTVTEQIDTHLASGSFGENDLVILGGGYSDIIAEAVQLRSGAQTPEQALANVRQAARDLATQARRLSASGARHIALVGTYDLGKSPWALATGQQGFLSAASGAFNDELVVELVNEGATMLYVDAALLFNLMYNAPAAYGFTDVTTPVCTSVDPGPGIGIGAGQVNSALCTPSTLLPSATYSAYMFADAIYPSTGPQVRFGDYAFSRISTRW